MHLTTLNKLISKYNRILGVENIQESKDYIPAADTEKTKVVDVYLDENGLRITHLKTQGEEFVYKDLPMRNLKALELVTDANKQELLNEIAAVYQ